MEKTMEELMKEIYQLTIDRKFHENQIEVSKNSIDILQKTIDLKKSELLAKMKEMGLTNYEKGGLIADFHSETNVGYTSEQDVINYLKEHNYTNLYKTKVTESLVKKDLKQALKTDEELKNALNNLTTTSTTEWVVVVDQETKQKMLEHMEELKKGK